MRNNRVSRQQHEADLAEARRVWRNQPLELQIWAYRKVRSVVRGLRQQGVID